MTPNKVNEHPVPPFNREMWENDAVHAYIGTIYSLECNDGWCMDDNPHPQLKRDADGKTLPKMGDTGYRMLPMYECQMATTKRTLPQLRLDRIP
jgi:hypothetical protein